RRSGGEERPGVQADRRQVRRRFSGARGSAGRPHAGRARGREPGVKAAAVVLAIALALALQTTLARFVIRGTVAVDLVLVVVVYAALAAGPVTGILTGAFAGLVQDALSSGLIGIGGLAKTLVGFLAGLVGTQF